jgi:uncharacterized protein (DUF58 family)
MILPSNRLLIVFGALLPLWGLAPSAPPARAAAVGLTAALALTAGIDAWLGRRRLAGLSVSAPSLIRLSKDRPGRLELTFHHPDTKVRHLRAGLALPPEIRADDPERRIGLPAGAERSRTEIDLTADRRGQYKLTSARLEAASPGGLWLVRQTRPLNAEIRVYPNLMAEGRYVSALFLRRGWIGSKARRRIGQGREFEMLREYLPGDSYEDLHWKATAKRAAPVTKVHQVERTQEVYVAVDASRLTARIPATDAADSSRQTILERYVASTLILALAAQRQGDLFGLLTFAERVQTFRRAKSGRGHFGDCREALYTLEPRLTAVDYSEAFSFIATRLRRRALIVFLTCLDDPVLAESFARHLPVLTRRHLVLAAAITPPGVRPVFSGDAPQTTDEVYDALARHQIWAGLRETGRKIGRQGAQLLTVSSETISPDLVTAYMRRKQRGAL